MAAIVTAGDMATCGHTATGSTNVLINNRGVTTLGTTVGGGPIIGPGMPTVLCQGGIVSVAGDAVTSHGDNAHAAARMVSTILKVFAG
mgnify:CR=1 FL=1